MRDATRAFNCPCIEKEGFEADDIIATYARQIEEAGGECVIISSDKDLMQLVTEKVSMYDTMKNKEIGPDQVEEKFGVSPDKVVDVQALAGDSVDNIPGVPGIGVKTAALLIHEYGDLETLLREADGIKQKKRRENLLEFADDARMSLELVTLKNDVSLDEKISDLETRPIDTDKLLAFLREMEFSTLTRRIENDHGGASEELGTSENTNTNVKADYETIYTEEDLDRWIEAAYARGVIAVDTETDSLNAMQANLVGISLSTSPGQACYIPLGHGAKGLALDDKDISRQLPIQKAMKRLKPMLEDPSILKVGQNIKYDDLVLSRYGAKLHPIDDTMLISYALDCGNGGHGMDDLAKRHLDHETIKFSDVAGTGKNKKPSTKSK